MEGIGFRVASYRLTPRTSASGVGTDALSTVSLRSAGVLHQRSALCMHCALKIWRDHCNSTIIPGATRSRPSRRSCRPRLRRVGVEDSRPARRQCSNTDWNSRDNARRIAGAPSGRIVRYSARLRTGPEAPLHQRCQICPAPSAPAAERSL